MCLCNTVVLWFVYNIDSLCVRAICLFDQSSKNAYTLGTAGRAGCVWHHYDQVEARGGTPVPRIVDCNNVNWLYGMETRVNRWCVCVCWI